MKPSDVVEDVAVVALAVGASSYLEGHPSLTALFGLIGVGAGALYGELRRQGN